MHGPVAGMTPACLANLLQPWDLLRLCRVCPSRCYACRRKLTLYVCTRVGARVPMAAVCVLRCSAVPAAPRGCDGRHYPQITAQNTAHSCLHVASAVCPARVASRRRTFALIFVSLLALFNLCCACVCVCVSVCVSVCLYVCVSVCLSVCWCRRGVGMTTRVCGSRTPTGPRSTLQRCNGTAIQRRYCYLLLASVASVVLL